MDDAPAHMPLRFLPLADALLGGVGKLSEGSELGADQTLPARRRDTIAPLPCVNSVGVFANGAGQSRRSTCVTDDVGKGSHAISYETYDMQSSANRKVLTEYVSYRNYMARANDRDPEIVARGERLKYARISAGYESPADAVRDLNFNQSSYYLHENGRSSFSFKMAQQRYAPAFKVNAEWLYSGVGEPHDSVTSETVPVVGYVSAGAELALYDQGQGPFDYVLPPREAKPTTVAAEIHGVSLGPLFDHALIFYDNVHSPITPELHGKLCVAGLEDGRVVVKQIMPGDAGRFHLLSNSAEPPIFNAEVLWAAKVTEIRPR